jgi:PDZ domain
MQPLRQLLRTCAGCACSRLARTTARVQGGKRGVLLTYVDPTASAGGQLQEGDVLAHFDGAPVSSDGTTPFRTGERIMFSYLVSQRFVGDTVKVRTCGFACWRNRNRCTCAFACVWWHLFDGAPVSSDSTTPFRIGERIMLSYLVTDKLSASALLATACRCAPRFGEILSCVQTDVAANRFCISCQPRRCLWRVNACTQQLRYRSAQLLHLCLEQAVCAQVTIMRGGEELERTLTLKGPRYLVPPHIECKDPAYYVLSGLVFTPLTEPYLQCAPLLPCLLAWRPRTEPLHQRSAHCFRTELF